MAGYTLPADTLVVPNITEIHHDPSVWPDPDLFNPDRFLDKGGHFCPPKENFVPFSMGESPVFGQTPSTGLRHPSFNHCQYGKLTAVLAPTKNCSLADSFQEPVT